MMMRFVGLLLMMCSCLAVCSQAQQRYSYELPKMGAPFQIIIYAENEQIAHHASAQCFTIVDSLNLIFSNYLPNSELSLFCTNGYKNSVQLSEPLFYILAQAKYAFKHTKGSFDITMTPVQNIWKAAKKTGTFPNKKQLRNALKITGMKYLNLDTNYKTAQLLKPNMQLDLGGIAQGFIVDSVLGYLQKQKGVSAALVNASGDIRVFGIPLNTNGWTIAVNMPGKGDVFLNRNILVHNMAVSTSGDSYQFVMHNGKKYAHILNPKTGYGVTNQRNVTVIAVNATAADWLATAACILPFKKVLKLVKKQEAHVLIGYIKYGETKFIASPGFSNFYK